MSLDIISFLGTKEKYERFYPYLKLKEKASLFSKESTIILEDMADYYSSQTEIQWDVFSTWFFMVKHPMFKPEKQEIYKTIFDKLLTHTVDEGLASELSTYLINKDYAQKIAETALSIVEDSGKETINDIATLIDKHSIELDKSKDVDDYIVEDTDEALIESLERKGGVPWRLKALQESVGNIMKGDFIAIAAYVGSGKTTMLVSEAVHMVDHIPEDEYILWFNNEEGGSKVRKRLAQSVTGMSKEEALKNPTLFLSEYKKSAVRDRIKVYDKGSITTYDILQTIKRYPPALIIIDQLYKVNFPGTQVENEVTRLANIFNWGRDLCKTYAPVITVHQADSTAAGQLWIEKNQLHGSKIGMPGEMDVIITLGANYDPRYENIRGLYTPKNKLTGLESYKKLVKLDPERASYSMYTGELE